MGVINSKKVVWFEGPDNVGKTTVIEEVVSKLLEKLRPDQVRVIRQPASTKYGELVYNLHHDYEGVRLEGFARQMMHVSAHLQSYNELKDDKTLVILQDRSFLSSMAYGYAYPQNPETRDAEIKWIWDIEATLIPNRLIPNYVVWFKNAPHEKSNEQWENFKKVQEAYQHVFGLDYVRTGMQQANMKLLPIYNDKGKLDSTVDSIVGALEEDYDNRFVGKL